MSRIAVAFALAVSLSAHAATFVVNDNGDAADASAGNGVCATAASVCTLRAALQEANALAGTDTIQFGIGSGPQTITPATSLPVASSLTLDGTTQPGTGAGPFVLIDGQNATNVGFDVSSSTTVTIQGLGIGRFTEAGVRVSMSSASLTIKRCHIGVGLDGVTAMANGDGILARVTNTSGGSLLIGDASGGGNVLSGNADMGIEVVDASGTGARVATFTVQGNKIGVASDGMTAVPNAGGGIRVDGQFGTVTIGGSIAGRNVISGNGGSGYNTQFFFQTTAMTFSHNYVGVAADGVTARGNNGNGARVVARQYAIDANVFAFNSANGLILSTGDQVSHIRGNRIAGNGNHGVMVGTLDNLTIGGVGGDANVIANNGGDGIALTNFAQAEIAENSIFTNTGLGIDLNDDGVSANDAGDADGNANGTQNYPTIASAVNVGGIAFVNGGLSAAASTAYNIRFFSNTAADSSGFGEGETFLGSMTVTTGAGGSTSFTFQCPAPVGTYVTATATNLGTSETSEFSNALIVSGPPLFRMAAASVTTPESGNVSLTIERINGATGAASVSWSAIPGSAGVADFTSASGIANFANGETAKTIDIAITPDALDEDAESFNVELSSPSIGTELGSPVQTTVHITDDDAGPSISIADASSAENTTPITFDVTLSAPSGKTVTVDYVTSNGSAIAGNDYAASAGTLTFAPGESSKTIAVPLVDDANIEVSETFTVTLSSAVSATGTITDDDGAPSITIDDVAVIEGDSATFTIALSGPSASTVTVGWSTSSGTATAGDDYGTASGTVMFAPGDVVETVTIVGAEDVVVENGETFFVDLAGPVNATLADAQGGGTIADDDGTPSLSINDPAVVEGMNATFTVTLAPASALPVSVNYATTSATAVDASDYTGAANSITFAAGETSKTIDVATLSDATAESAEQFAMTLSSPSGAVIADASASGTIIDDDGAPRVTIGNATLSESNAAMTFTVDLSHASSVAIDVTWATADGTASSADYTPAGGTLSFAPGETSKTIDVTIAEDSVVEEEESFFVQLGSAMNATITDDEGAGTIANDDGPVEVSIANDSASEGTTLVFVVTLNAASAEPVTVQWTSADGTAGATDYTAASGSVVFAPGAVSATISIATTSDSTFEPDETLFVNLLGATGASVADAQAMGTITNDDPAPAVPSVSISGGAVTEGDAGTASLVFTVTLNMPTVNMVTIDYSTGAGTATSGVDYVPTSGTLPFAPGVTTQNVVVPIVGDTSVEGNETLIVTLAMPVNATLGVASATGTILDDDVAPAVPSIAIANASVAEGNSGSTSLTFEVTLSVPTVAMVTVDYATGGGTASAVTDYATTSGTLTFAPGVTTQNVVVPIVGDTSVEGNETLIVTLAMPINATLGIASATGTILDDDVAPAVPSIAIANASVAEGNAGSASLTFAVTLSVPTVAMVTVDYATGGGTASVGTDYATTSGTLTFAPGVTTQNVVVPVVGDTSVEGNETLIVTLAMPINATLGIASATGTILDDDSAAVIPGLSIDDVAQFEGDHGATLFAFPVTLSATTALPVSVAWTTAGSTSDFIAASGTLVFAPGMTSQTISIAVHGDEDLESDETFTVTMSAPSNATIADGVGTGTIRNDDERSPSMPTLRASAVSVVEGDDAQTEVRLTLTLSSRATSGAVRWLTRGASARGGIDFVEASGRATFGSSTTATIALAVAGDRVPEETETFVVELFDAEGVMLRDSSAEITIIDDDAAVPLRGIVLAVGSVRGNAGSRFGTAMQMVNFSDEPASGTFTFVPAGTTGAGRAVPYSLAPREMRVFEDLLPELGLGGLATLDIVAETGPLPRMSVRIYDDGSGDGTTGFTLPVVTPDDALVAGDSGLLFPPDDPEAMRFNVGVRTLDDGAAIAIEVRDRTGATVHETSREFPATWFSQMSGNEFAGIPLRAGDYVAIRVTRGGAILYGAAVDNVTNDPSVHLITK